MQQVAIKELIDKFNAGNCTEEELAILENWYLQWQPEDYDMDGDRLNAIMESVWQSMPLSPVSKPVKLWPRIIGVAAAVAAIVFGIWFFNGNRHSDPALSSRVSRDLNDIAPGGNKATLKIGDGEAITLSDKQTGVIVGNDLRYSDNTLVIQSGPLSSRANAKDPSGLGMTTITTPRGGTYQVTLPDGTKVWLNAASVLTYTMPLKERGGVRLVKLSGEAYFEVFRNKNQPFVVTTKNLTTTVLGTHFNISAYEDENSAKATLLEGSVRVTTLSSRANAKDLDSSYPRNDKGVSNDERSLPAVRDDGDGVTLTPNQQATTANNNITVKQVNPNEAVAWKNGKFVFNDEPLENIMRNVARWYDVDIVYQNIDPKKTFWGSISRFENVSKVLEKLELTGGIHFKIEGRKIIVTK